MGALQYVDHPGYSAIIFRRTYSDLILPEALMERARDWLTDTGARWAEKEKTWTFPSGATLSFGYLKSEQDRHRYKSAAFQYIFFDELTQFTRTQYLYLFSRLRRLTTDQQIPLRMRSASNPGDIGHTWVAERFVDPGHPDRPFIPSQLEDNPFLDADSYDDSLSHLDPVTRAQLRWGDWRVRPEGGMFDRANFPIVNGYDQAADRRVRYWDLAATDTKQHHDPDWTCGVLMSSNSHESHWTVEHVLRERVGPADVERLIRRTANRDGPNTYVAMEQEPGSAGKSVIDHYRRNILGGYAFIGVRATGSKTIRATALAGQSGAEHVRVVKARWNEPYFDELETFPMGRHDDQVDATAGAYQFLTRPRDWRAW